MMLGGRQIRLTRPALSLAAALALPLLVTSTPLWTSPVAAAATPPVDGRATYDVYVDLDPQVRSVELVSDLFGSSCLPLQGPKLTRVLANYYGSYASITTFTAPGCPDTALQRQGLAVLIPVGGPAGAPATRLVVDLTSDSGAGADVVGGLPPG